MPKLLSLKEVTDISTKMTEEYGLAPVNILLNKFTHSSPYDAGFMVEIGRLIPVPVYEWFPWYKKNHFYRITDFYVASFEELLKALQYELSKFDSRAKTAEQFRDKYNMEEADAALDNVLRDKR